MAQPAGGDVRDAASKRRPWHAPPFSFAEAHALALELGLSPATATILARRGLGDPAAARCFLDASETHDPAQLGVEEPVETIGRHVRAGNLIAVHGDYDVDGVCSTAIAVRALRGLGAPVRPVLPSRMDDGYGLSAATVSRLHAQGVHLLVTVDCGITAVEEVAHARALGMDVVVTDHHRPGEALPDCPIVHPVLGGYPCPELCATAVTYKLCQALWSASGRDPADLEEDLDLVALATVADVVPLLGENRTLVKRGLRALAGTGKVGLRALMQVAGVEPQAVNEHSIGFVLAPRINAAGRLYRADAPLELLLTTDRERALEVARELDAVNSERQAVETRILFEAEAQLSDDGRKEEPLHVLAGEGWHPGVIGIVASRLVERYHRPCVLVALDEEGRGRGSGRSISAYDLHEGLRACASHLVRFGGHRMAAGLEIDRTRVDPFRAALTDHARASLRAEDLVPTERVDLIASGSDVGLGLAEELDLLRPFGMGNPTINLLLPAARLSDLREMGEGRHASFTVTSAGVRTRAVAFGVGSQPIGGEVEEGSEPRHDLVARLEANEWRGTVEPRLVLRSLHALPDPSSPRSSPAASGCAACSCRATGTDWWTAVWRELDADLRSPQELASAAPARTVIDVRAQGGLASLTELLSTRESVAVMCADVSRRRALTSRELAPARFDRPPARFVSSRCTTGTEPEPASIDDRSFWLLDYAGVTRRPQLLPAFVHVFALDPPPLRRLRSLIERSGAPDRASFLHLGWGEAEIDFAQMALEQEYGLRSSLRAVYGALAQSSEPLSGTALEDVLRGGGRHPRSPHLAGRCLRVLAELGLVELERSSATVTCTIISGRRVELEQSEAFRAYTAIYREGQRFLSEAGQTSRRAKAA